MLRDALISVISAGYRTGRRIWLRYLVAIFIVAIAAAIRLILLRTQGMDAPFLMFYPAVIITALYGGLPAGLFATALCVLADYYLFTKTLQSFYVVHNAIRLALVLFSVNCAAISFVIDVMHKALVRATERKKKDEALLESEELLQQATRVAQSGIWNHDHLTNSIYWSPIMHEIYGLAPHETVTFQAFLDYTHPQDLERVGAALRRANDPAGSGLLDVEHRIIRRDGTVRWVAARSQTFFDNEGGARRAVRTVGATLDITERKWAEDALQESEGRFRAVFENGAIAMAITGFDCRFQEVNPAFCRMLGYTEGELVGRNFAEFTHPDDLPQNLAGIERMLKGEAATFRMEKRYFRKDGSIVWIDMSTASVLDPGGKPLYIGTHAQDVTERKLAEERIRAALLEKETLLKELYHRTKNNMQVISSLINLQAARVGESGVQHLAQETRNRIRAMALVHEKLYQSSDLSNIDMKDYIGDLARSIFDNYENVASQISLDLMLDDIRIPIECAIPCGLILNELISNSVKHAFPGDRRGEIRLALYREGERLRLEYADNGVGLGGDYEDLKKKSMGLLVVEALIKQVGGAMEITNRNGAGYIITFGKRARQIKSFI